MEVGRGGRRVGGHRVALLVHSFYARVRADPLLGPVFNRAISDWDAHLDKLCAFWSSVTLMTGRYKGTPMKAHAELPEISSAHFERWLVLFQATAIKTCPPNAGRRVRGPRQPYCELAATRHRVPSWRKHRAADREAPPAANCRQRGLMGPEVRAWRESARRPDRGPDTTSLSTAKKYAC